MEANVNISRIPETSPASDAKAPSQPEMNQSNSQSKWLYAGFFVGLLFLAVALGQADLTASFEVLQNLEISWVAAAAMFGFIFMIIKTLRWQIILKPVTTETFPALLQTVYIGTAANLIISHTGELLRMNILARRRGASSSAVLTSIGLERILDFSSLMVITSVALMIEPTSSPLLWSACLISCSMVLLGMVGVMLLLNPETKSALRIRRLFNVLPENAQQWLDTQVRRGQSGVSIIQSPTLLVQLTLISLIQWACIVAAVWACVQATGTELALFGAFAVFILTIIGLTLPSSPAQLGTIQLAFVFGLELVGLEATTGLAASIVYLMSVNFVMMIGGGLCWLNVDLLRPVQRHSPKHQSQV